MVTIDTTDQQTLAERMRWQTERFLERAARSALDPRTAYERLVRRLHGLDGRQSFASTMSNVPRS